MTDNTVCDNKGNVHNVHSSNLVADERRVKDRDNACVCGKVMYQEDRTESACFVFIQYECTCGEKREFIIDKREV